MNKKRYLVPKYQTGSSVYNIQLGPAPGIFTGFGSAVQAAGMPLDSGLQGYLAGQQLELGRERMDESVRQFDLQFQRQKDVDQLAEMKMIAELSENVGGMEFLPGTDTEAAKEMLQNSGYNDAIANGNIQEAYKAYSKIAPDLQGVARNKTYYDKSVEAFGKANTTMMNILKDEDLRSVLQDDFNQAISQWGESIKQFGEGSRDVSISDINPANFGIDKLIDPTKVEEFVKRARMEVDHKHQLADRQMDLAEQRLGLAKGELAQGWERLNLTSKLNYLKEELPFIMDSAGIFAEMGYEDVPFTTDDILSNIETMSPEDRATYFEEFQKRELLTSGRASNIPGNADEWAYRILGPDATQKELIDFLTKYTDATDSTVNYNVPGSTGNTDKKGNYVVPGGYSFNPTTGKVNWLTVNGRQLTSSMFSKMDDIDIIVKDNQPVLRINRNLTKANRNKIRAITGFDSSDWGGMFGQTKDQDVDDWVEAYKEIGASRDDAYGYFPTTAIAAHYTPGAGNTSAQSGDEMGFRNNNPLNIRNQDTGEFMKFDSMEEGLEYNMGDIKKKLSGKSPALIASMEKRGRAGEDPTLEDLIETWAPREKHGGDNPDGDINNYLALVSSILDVSIDTPLSEFSGKERDLAMAMMQVECPQCYKHIINTQASQQIEAKYYDK